LLPTQLVYFYSISLQVYFISLQIQPLVLLVTYLIWLRKSSAC